MFVPTLRFAVATTAGAGASAFADLRTALRLAGGPDLTPVWVPAQNAMLETMKEDRADAAWCPPLAAADMDRVGLAKPVATVLRRGEHSRWSALVASSRSGIGHVGQLARARIGWVSPESACGFFIPRVYLQQLGVPLVFGAERFLRTHGAVISALRSGAIDVGATYATRKDGRFVGRWGDDGVPLATMGPIPGDVIVAREDVAESLERAFSSVAVNAAGPLARRLEVTGFGRVPAGHLSIPFRWGTLPRGTGTWHAFVPMDDIA